MDAIYELMVLKMPMRFNSLVLWCLDKFINKQACFIMSIYEALGEMWRLMCHSMIQGTKPYYCLIRITLLYRIDYLQFVFFKALNHVGPRPGLGLCLHVGFALLTLPLASPLCWVGSGFGSSSRLRPSLRKHKQNLTMKITKWTSEGRSRRQKERERVSEWQRGTQNTNFYYVDWQHQNSTSFLR